MAPSPGSRLTYAETGVETDAALTALARLVAHVRRPRHMRPDGTSIGDSVLESGLFASVVSLGDNRGLALATDGVGTKVMVAEMLGKYDTIGIDCVAMNVNDLVCVGARPLTMVDYAAVERVDPAALAEIAMGLAEGAARAGISICGGELAELPDMLKGSRPGSGFDLAGTAIGTVALDRILIGADAVSGDAVIGIASSGIHANGMTLARRVFFADGGLAPAAVLPELGRAIGEELLEPTAIYVAECAAVLERVPELKALIHITGDGFLNLNRVGARVGYRLDALPEPPSIFRALHERGGVSADDMYAVYNMGVGMCAVVAEAGADAVIAAAAAEGKAAWRIGTVTADAGRVAIAANPLTGTDLIGAGKAFGPA